MAEAKALGIARGQLIGAIAIVCKEFGQPFEANRDFIAHARSDIPLLLDALAAAQASQAAAYRAGLEAAAEYIKTHTSARETPPQFSNLLAKQGKGDSE